MDLLHFLSSSSDPSHLALLPAVLLVGFLSHAVSQGPAVLCLVAQACPTLRPHGRQPARLLCPGGFSRQEAWSGLLCPPPGDLPDPGIKPRSATLQADSLPSEPQIPALAAHPASGEEAGDAKALLRSLGDITPPWWNAGELFWRGESWAAWQRYLSALQFFRVVNNYYPVLITTMEELQAFISK